MCKTAISTALLLLLNHSNGRVLTASLFGEQGIYSARMASSFKDNNEPSRYENSSQPTLGSGYRPFGYTKYTLLKYKENNIFSDIKPTRLRGGQGSCPQANDQVAGDVRMEDDMQEDSSKSEYAQEGDDPTVQELLWEAAKLGEEDTIEKLVQDGADVNAHDPTFGGWTAMHYAAQNGRWRAISALVRLGAKVR
jgi:hypothetical protein